jgi:hypothetical protein
MNELPVALDADDVVPRVQGAAQLTWSGGDPGVDTPVVVLERLDASTGAWDEVTTRNGLSITDALPDILLSHTPDPLYPWETPQSHTWWACWQAVPHDGDRTALATGVYRLHVYGRAYLGGATEWPWPTSDYEVLGAEFEVLVAQLSVTLESDRVFVSLDGPEWGYRLVDLEGNSRGANPVDGLTVTWTDAAGATVDESVTVEGVEGGRSFFTTTPPPDATLLTVTDAHGNTGSVGI